MNCTSNVTCLPVDNAVCLNERCRCTGGYKKDGLVCVQVLRSDCIDKSDCSHLANVECVNDKCQCENGYLDNGTTCLPRRLGDSCEYNSECTAIIEHSFCAGSRCLCLYGVSTSNNQLCQPDGKRLMLKSFDFEFNSNNFQVNQSVVYLKITFLFQLLQPQ